LNGTPPHPEVPDDVDDRYRRAAALDPSRPSEAVRNAILRHAENLAARRAGNAGEDADENVGATIEPGRPAQVRPWRRPAIFGTLAAAALAGLLITPRWLPPHEDARQKAAVSPTSRAPVAEQPSSEPEPPSFVPDELRSPGAPAASPPSPVSESSSEVQATRADAAGLAKQDALARKFATDSGAMAPRASADRSAQEGIAANAPSAKTQDTAGARPAFVAPSPPAAPASAAPPAPAASLARQASQVQSLTAAVGRRTDAAAALRQAAGAGDMAALQTLLSRTTDIDRPSGIDARDGNGRTALMLATLHGRRAAVDALLAAGADPNAADAKGTTPLQAAVAGGQPEIIAALQRAGGR